MSLAVKQGARLRAGRYELERLLGRGGAASVWLARDTLLERPVAIKLLSEGLAADHDWLARFRREARIAARLQHPNLVSIYDFESESERPYLVMAYLPGGSLADRLDQGARPDAERLARDVLSALAHIHAAGIVHRDVKPGNVLLDRDGRACLTDFGIARPEDATSITQTGQIPGTVRYMAPELWRGEPATERSDLFACGVLLSQCMDDAAPARLIGLVERLAAESPELRPESAQEALALLDRRGPAPEPEPTRTATTAVAAPAAIPVGDPTPATAAASEVAGPPRTPSRPTTQASTPRWPALAGLAAVVLAAGVALASSIGGGDDEAPGDGSVAREAGAGGQAGAGSGDADSADGGSGAAAPSEAAPDPYRLNDKGYALIQDGRYDEAIPILERAVAGLEGSGDVTYAYALYNLGHALRLAGRPAEAIPILEQRLEIPNQTDVVAAELELAREEAGLTEEGGKPPKPEKEPKEPKD